MKKILVVPAVLVAMAAAPAYAGTHFSIGFFTPAPVYYAPAPVTYYQPAPVYYAPAPISYYTPTTYYYGGYRPYYRPYAYSSRISFYDGYRDHGGYRDHDGYRGRDDHRGGYGRHDRD